jgi:hypothetical protein
MDLNGFMLHLIEMAAHFLGGMDMVVEMGDKIGDRLLKIDVVLPKSVIGIDKQRLRFWETNDLGRHSLIIKNINRDCLLQVAPVRTGAAIHYYRHLELDHRLHFSGTSKSSSSCT